MRYNINKQFGNEIIPQGGAALNILNNTTLKTSVSKGYRPPSVRELYLFPPANENLVPEEMMNYDIGWIQRWKNQMIKTELTLFLCHGENSIITTPFSPPPPPFYNNTGKFRNTGIEFSGSYQPFKNLHLMLNYTYINMEEKMPATPEHNVFFSGNYTLNKLGLNLQIQEINNLYGSDGKQIRVIEKNYTLLGLRIKYQALPSVHVFVSGNNLLNEHYAINYGYPMPGVHFMAGVNFNLKKDFQ
ncbi:MAG: TonB-dependent receptor [Bacteroidales bacterium]|nr:TonB-dependent receptor [Bacteroidales bacterium]